MLTKLIFILHCICYCLTYNKINCPENKFPLSNEFCGSIPNNITAITGECITYNSQYDEELRSCVQIIKTKAIVECPHGYKIANSNHKFCKNLARLDPTLSCDSLYFNENKKCLKFKYKPAEFGCRPEEIRDGIDCIGIEINLADIECPEGFSLNLDYEKIEKSCVKRSEYKTIPLNKNPNSVKRKPYNFFNGCHESDEMQSVYKINGTNLNEPLLKCISVSYAQGKLKCPDKSLIYKSWMQKYKNRPFIIVDNNIKDLNRYCVRNITQPLSYTCSDIKEKLVMHLTPELLQRMILSDQILNFNSANSIYQLENKKQCVKNLIYDANHRLKKSFDEFSKDLEIFEYTKISDFLRPNGDPIFLTLLNYFLLYEKSLFVVCASYDVFEPFYTCPVGYKLTYDVTCKPHDYSPPIIRCPPGLHLAKESLDSHSSHPLCMGKAEVNTKYSCKSEDCIPDIVNRVCLCDVDIVQTEKINNRTNENETFSFMEEMYNKLDALNVNKSYQGFFYPYTPTLFMLRNLNLAKEYIDNYLKKKNKKDIIKIDQLCPSFKYETAENKTNVEFEVFSDNMTDFKVLSKIDVISVMNKNNFLKEFEHLNSPYANETDSTIMELKKDNVKHNFSTTLQEYSTENNRGSYESLISGSYEKESHKNKMSDRKKKSQYYFDASKSAFLLKEFETVDTNFISSETTDAVDSINKNNVADLNDINLTIFEYDTTDSGQLLTTIISENEILNSIFGEENLQKWKTTKKKEQENAKKFLAIDIGLLSLNISSNQYINYFSRLSEKFIPKGSESAESKYDISHLSYHKQWNPVNIYARPYIDRKSREFKKI